jgi:hypothetical protein
MPYRLHQRVISSLTINPCNPERSVAAICRSLPESTITSPVQATEIPTEAAATNPIGVLRKPALRPVFIYTGVSLPSSTINDVGHELGRRREIRRAGVLECLIMYVDGIITQGCYIQLLQPLVVENAATLQQFVINNLSCKKFGTTPFLWRR